MTLILYFIFLSDYHMYLSLILVVSTAYAEHEDELIVIWSEL
jgi:hypothetical protein